MQNALGVAPLLGGGHHVDDLAAALAAELDGAGRESEQGVVPAAPDVGAGVEVGAALADEDLAGVDLLAAEALHAETLRVRVTTVAGGACALLVCHVCLSALLDAGDLDARELLTVALALLVAGLVLVLLDDDLRAAEVIQNLGRDRDLRQRIGVGRHGVAVDEEDGGQLDRLTLGSLDTIERDDRADLDLLLPATGANNCVNHVDTCFIGDGAGAIRISRESQGVSPRGSRARHVPHSPHWVCGARPNGVSRAASGRARDRRTHQRFTLPDPAEKRQSGPAARRPMRIRIYAGDDGHPRRHSPLARARAPLVAPRQRQRPRRAARVRGARWDPAAGLRPRPLRRPRGARRRPRGRRRAPGDGGPAHARAHRLGAARAREGSLTRPAVSPSRPRATRSHRRPCPAARRSSRGGASGPDRAPWAPGAR